MAEENIQFSTNAEELNSKLNALPAKLMLKIMSGVKQGMRLFETELVEGQMSGQHGNDYGVNRGSGDLADSWSIKELSTKGEWSVVLGTGVKYALVHQKGGDFGRDKAWGKPSKHYTAHYNKRLFVPELYESDGTEIIQESVDTKVREFLKESK